MYTPVLKNRTIEMNILKDILKLKACDKILPMIEIVQEKTRSNSDNTYIEDLIKLYDKSDKKFLLNFPQITPKKSYAAPVREFLTTVNRNTNIIFESFNKLNKLKNLIPVISFNDKVTPEIGDYTDFISKLPAGTALKGIRVNSHQYQKIGERLHKIIKEGDYLILDIDSKSHSNPVFKKTYKEINDQRKEIGFVSILLNSNRPIDFYNKDIVDGEPIIEMDNSIFNVFSGKGYNFTGFADYGGIANSLPTSGGAISPAGIYFSLENNYFIGYRADGTNLSEFWRHIAPSIYRSEYWKEFSEEHHAKCPGCKMLKDIVKGNKTGMSQGAWKGITMGHYIFCMIEYFCSTQQS